MIMVNIDYQYVTISLSGAAQQFIYVQSIHNLNIFSIFRSFIVTPQILDTAISNTRSFPMCSCFIVLVSA